MTLVENNSPNLNRWLGTWSGATIYVLGDGVAYAGSSYLALKSNTNVTPGTDATAWQLLASKGDTGAAGATGSAGPGLPTGGTAGQVPAKIDGTNYNTHWVDVADPTKLPLAGGTMAGTLDMGENNIDRVGALNVDAAIRFKVGDSGFVASLSASSIDGDIGIYLPSTAGTLALLSDVPSPAGSDGQVQLKSGSGFGVGNSTVPGTLTTTGSLSVAGGNTGYGGQTVALAVKTVAGGNPAAEFFNSSGGLVLDVNNENYGLSRISALSDMSTASYLLNGSGITFGHLAVSGWSSSGGAPTGADTGISVLAPGSLAIGTGASGATDGSLTLQNLTASGSITPGLLNTATTAGTTQGQVNNDFSAGANTGHALWWSGSVWKILDEDPTKLPLAGGTMAGDIDAGGHSIVSLMGISVGGGGITFADSTIQTTAYTGAAPALANVLGQDNNAGNADIVGVGTFAGAMVKLDNQSGSLPTPEAGRLAFSSGVLYACVDGANWQAVNLT